MGRELPPLPPSFEPGSGATDENALKSADLRHQGATSVVPGPGYEGYKGPESSNWQYCQELSPEASGQSSTGDVSVEDHSQGSTGDVSVEDRSQSSTGDVSVEDHTDDGDGSEPGHEKNGHIKEFARRSLGAVAAFAAAVGGMFGVGHAASEVSNAYTTTTCRDFEMHGAKPLPDGTVEADPTDRDAIQAFLNDSANGLSIDHLSVGTPQEPGSEYSEIFGEGTVAEVCVTRDPIDGITDVDTNTKISPSNPSFQFQSE